MKLLYSWSRYAAIAWLMVVIVIIAFAVRQGASFDSSIMALLPESDQQPLVQQAANKMSKRYSSRLVVMLSSGDENLLRQSVERLALRLESNTDVSNVLWQIDEERVTNQSLKELLPYRFSILDGNSRALLLDGQFEQLRNRAIQNVFGPLTVAQASIVEDPFGLLNELMLGQSDGLRVKSSNRLLKVSGASIPSYIISLTLSGDPFDPAVQRNILETINIEQPLMQEQGISLAMSGMLLHAAAGAEQATKEISTIGMGSLFGILVVVIAVFRQAKSVLLMLFPVAIGCVTASAVTILLFDRVHMVTFAFGAGLVGVSIDYALHFLSERRVSEHQVVMPKVLPGLLLGLFSSVIAYAAQSLAPFPGLRQMAVFSVVGLCASWLTVVLWLPVFTRQDPVLPLGAAASLDKLRYRFPVLERSPVLLVVLAILIVLSAFSLMRTAALDDIRLLQTSSSALLEQERKVQQAIAGSSSAQFLLVSGDSVEQVLQTEELIASALDELVVEKVFEDYQMLSQALPSENRQAENSELIRRLYEQQLKSFYTVLNIDEGVEHQAQEQFEQISDRVLVLDAWVQQQGSERWKDLLISDQFGASATVIRFSGKLTESAGHKLRGIASRYNGVIYVDQVKNISSLMRDYRQQIVTWVLLAYGCVFLVLLARYRQQVWRVITPPLLASVFTLACLVQLEGGINLFHLMALILVLGIGVDMGIFLFETDGAAHTWLAVSLSCYTSLLAFGLLSLSDTPVLHHFGLTVLIGLVFVWLLAPIVRRGEQTLFQVHV